MRVVVPYAENQAREHPGLFPETVAALQRFSPAEPDYVDVSGHDAAYFELLHQRWQDSSTDLAIIEHDIVVHERVFRVFRHCPQEWCVFGYRKDANPWVATLGCVRFKRSLIAATSGLFGRVARHGNDAEVGDGMPSRHWVRTDTRMALELREAGFVPHEHGPRVGHLNPTTVRLWPEG